jgi:hypothetical protein
MCTGWQVVGRQGGADGQTVTHYFTQEDQARAMLQRMRDTVPSVLSNQAKITVPTLRSRAVDLLADRAATSTAADNERSW